MIVRYAGDRFTGLSSDTKPTNVANGAEFITTDTKYIYLKVSGAWETVTYSPPTITLSGNVTGSGTTAITTTIGEGVVTNAMLAGSIAYSKMAAMTSAQLAGIISDETGTGLLVFQTSPTIITPTIAKLANLTSNGYVYTSGGDGALNVNTGSTGSGSIVLATSPTFVTQITAPKIIGGTSTTSSLTLQATSGVGATGADIHFLVGNNGATEAMTILNSGLVGVGTIAPGYLMDLRGTTDTAYLNITSSADANNTTLRIGTDGESAYINATGGSSGSLKLNIYAVTKMFINSSGYVGINTIAPGSPLAVNRQADDGAVIDIEQADTVEGNISVSGNTVSYNAFVGSHYTQLKANQEEFPIGAVVISTGDIIPCSNHSKTTEVEVPFSEATTIVTKSEARQSYTEEIEDKENIISSTVEYEYNPETDETEEKVINVYGTKPVIKHRLKTGYYHKKLTGEFYKIKDGYIIKDNKFYLVDTVNIDYPGKEYFVYVNTTSTAADPKVYGVWFGKLSDNAKEMSFGKPNKPVYLVAQVGLFKILVTSDGGNIRNGDYLETSIHPMFAQKQTGTNRKNSTVAKALISVDWDTEQINPQYGIKTKLIPCIF